ncbi:MAG: glycosyltransferase family 39 protein [Candidatus Omnitrophota bacterium]
MRVNFKYIFILLLISYVYLMLGNGVLSLTNPDEVFYVQTAKEMMHQKTWLVPYLFDQPQFEKPILLYWLLRVSFIIFGVTSFGSRFFPAAFGMIGVLAVYLLTFMAFKDNRKAFISGLVLSSAGFYVGMTRTVFTDMIFSVFILLSLVSFYWGYSDKKRKSTAILGFFIFAGLAVLTKGPLGALIPMAAVALFLLLRKQIGFMFCRPALLGVAVFSAISLPWYIYIIQKYGNAFIQEFFVNDHVRRLLSSEHSSNDTWYFYPFSMIACMFPWSLFVIFAFWRLVKKISDKASPAYLFLASWLIMVFLAFQFAHSKLVSYILPLFPALAIITADFLDDCIINKRKIITVLSAGLWVLFVLFPIALIIGSFKYPDYVPSRVPVYIFAGFEFVLMAAMVYAIIKKKYMLNIYIVSLFVPLLICFAFLSSNSYLSSVSSKKACEFLLNNYEVKGRILCSKMFARGVRFGTDMPVAVINIGGKQFFSPHPIPVLDSDDKAIDFLKKQKVTYCIVSKGIVSTLERFAAKQGFTLEKLRVEGNEYILRVTKK